MIIASKMHLLILGHIRILNWLLVIMPNRGTKFFANTRCAIWDKLKISAYLQFNLFLLLFMDLTALFGIIHESYCTIQLTFTFIYSTFNKKFSISAKYK